MISSIGKNLAEEYLNSLSKNIAVIPYENGCRLMTPFTRPDGEAIGLEIALLSDGDFCISDLGDTLGYLYVNGITKDLAAPDYIHSIAEAYGVSIRDNAMTVGSCREDLGNVAHRLIQAILAITSFAQGRVSIVSGTSEANHNSL